MLNERTLEFVEVVFSSDASEISGREFIEKMHSKSIKLWVNALTLDDEVVLNGGHDDNKSILQDPDIGWGWLIKNGFDVIQTDWPYLLRKYVNYLKTTK
jgi:glycerophosphoryl diester phosphodiesterase